MAATLERVEEALLEAGFEYSIPTNSTIFAGGDGANIEDAPVGYYRFHFWRTDEKIREHENWLTCTDTTGPICISIMEDFCGTEKIFRLLVRTIFATKSLVLFSSTLRMEGINVADSGKIKGTEQTLRIISIALREFIRHEQSQLAMREEEFGAFSIRSSITFVDSMHDSGLIRSLPTSRMREDKSTNCDVSESVCSLSRNQSLLRRNSSRIVSSLSRCDSKRFSPESASQCEEAEDEDLSHFSNLDGRKIRKMFKAFSNQNTLELAKTCTQIKEEEFTKVLLHLEMTIATQVYHIDVIKLSGSRACQSQQDSTWDSFCSVLGKKLTKTAFQRQSLLLAVKGRVPSEVMQELLTEEGNSSSNNQNIESMIGKHTDLNMKNRRLAEFFINEIRFQRKLQLIHDYFGYGMSECWNSEQEYREIFDGFKDLLQVYSDLSQFLSGSVNSNSTVLEVAQDILDGKIDLLQNLNYILTAMKSSKFIYGYTSFLADYQERIDKLRALLGTRSALQEQREKILLDVRSGREDVTDILAHIFQHLARYSLQLRGIIEATSLDEKETSNMVISLYQQSVRVINNFDVKCAARTEATNLIETQRRVANCPPIVKSERTFITKMAAYEVEKGQVEFSKRMTLFLFNDLVIAATKRRNKSGAIMSSKSTTTTSVTHDFLFSAPLESVNISRLPQNNHAKTRKGHTTASFSIQLEPSKCIGWNGKQCLMLDQFEGRSNLLLAPKKQEKLAVFMEQLTRYKHDALLTSTNSSQVYWRRGGEGEGDCSSSNIYFHVFNQEDYVNWPHKHRFAIIYSHQAPLLGLANILEDNSIDVAAVVQARQGAFRWIIKSREMLVSSDTTFEPSTPDFHPINPIKDDLLKAIHNGCLLHSIYPPWEPSRLQIMQSQLIQSVKPYSKGLMRKFHQLFNKLQIKDHSSRKIASPVIDEDSSDVIMQSSLDVNMDGGVKGGSGKERKKSTLGKMFGRIKSPLTRIEE